MTRMTKKDAADILGIEVNDVSEAAIRKAFRTRSKKHHPDVGGATEAFTKLQLAMDVLLNKPEPPDFGKDLSEFMGAFQAVLQNCRDIQTVDIIGRTKDTIRRRIQEIDRVQDKLQADEAELKSVLQRLICPMENDPIKNMLEEQIAGIQSAIETNKQLMVSLEAAIKIGDNYKYIIDAGTTNLSSGYTNSTIWRTF